MEPVTKSIEAEIARAKRWAGAARDWDLARELDVCKETRDSLQRRIGLLGLEGDQNNYYSLVLRNRLNQVRIDAVEIEIMKRRKLI